MPPWQQRGRQKGVASVASVVSATSVLGAGSPLRGRGVPVRYRADPVPNPATPTALPTTPSTSSALAALWGAWTMRRPKC